VFLFEPLPVPDTLSGLTSPPSLVCHVCPSREACEYLSGGSACSVWLSIRASCPFRDPIVGPPRQGRCGLLVPAAPGGPIPGCLCPADSDPRRALVTGQPCQGLQKSFRSAALGSPSPGCLCPAASAVPWAACVRFLFCSARPGAYVSCGVGGWVKNRSRGSRV
jgi:hypothetical protein